MRRRTPQHTVTVHRPPRTAEKRKYKIRRIIRRNLRYEQTCTHYRRKPRDRRRMRPCVPRTRRPGRVYLPKLHRKCGRALPRNGSVVHPCRHLGRRRMCRCGPPCPLRPRRSRRARKLRRDRGIFPLSGHHRRDVGENDLHRSHGSLPRIARGIPIYDIREIGENSQRLVNVGRGRAHRARYTTAPPRRG